MKVIEAGVNVTCKLDLGYQPFLDYLENLNGRRPENGARNYSNVELSVWKKAQFEEGEEVDMALQEMAEALEGQLRAQLRRNYPEAFSGAPVDDDHTFLTTNRKVEVNLDGDF